MDSDNNRPGRSSRLIIKSKTTETSPDAGQGTRLVIKQHSNEQQKENSLVINQHSNVQQEENSLVINQHSNEQQEAVNEPNPSGKATTSSKSLLLKKSGPSGKATTSSKKLVLKSKKKKNDTPTTNSKKLLLKNTQTTKSQRMKAKSSTGKLLIKKKDKASETPKAQPTLLIKQTPEETPLDQTINSVSEKALAMREKMSKQNTLGPVVKAAKAINPELLKTSSVSIDKESLSAEAVPLAVTHQSKEIHRENTQTIHTITDSLGQIYHHIPNGHYALGESGEQREIIHDFYLCRYPVTKGQFYDFLEETDKVFYSQSEYDEIESVSPNENCPMVNVSWNDAIEYCRWLSKKTGDLYALPTCDEWEAAARGKDSRVYPWGNEVPNSSLLCFIDGVLEPKSTAAVDYYEANKSPFDLIGMAGNVMEWTRDAFDDERDPHILRGGSWKSTEEFCTTYSVCFSFPPTKRRSYAGLRLLYIPASQKDSYLGR